MTGLRLSRIFWIGAAAILIVAALVALAAVVRGDFSDTDGRILGTLAVLLYTGGGLFSGLALIDRGKATWLGWTIAGASPVTLALMLRALWEWVGDGDDNGDLWQLAWSAFLVLLAGLVAATALLLAKRDALVRLAWAAGGLSALAALLSVIAIWDENPGDSLAKALAVAWILAALAYLLVPVLQRFTAAGVPTDERVLANLDNIELVATRSRLGTEVRLAPGERLVLRRRT